MSRSSLAGSRIGEDLVGTLGLVPPPTARPPHGLPARLVRDPDFPVLGHSPASGLVNASVEMLVDREARLEWSCRPRPPSVSDMHTNNTASAPSPRSLLDLAVPASFIPVQADTRAARRRGRKDWRTPLDQDRHTPWTRQTMATLAEKVHMIGEDLHDQVGALDQTLAGNKHELTHLASSPTPEPPPVHGTTGVALDQAVRADRSHAAAERARDQRVLALEMEEAALLAKRSHLHHQAREAVEHLAETFKVLASAHRAGQMDGPWWRFWARGTAPRPGGMTAATSTQPPEFQFGGLPWLDADIPLIDPSVSPSQKLTLSWVYRHFGPGHTIEGTDALGGRGLVVVGGKTGEE